MRTEKLAATKTDAELAAWYEAIARDPANFVKAGPSKGHMKIRALKLRDILLDEQINRRLKGDQS